MFRRLACQALSRSPGSASAVLPRALPLALPRGLAQGRRGFCAPPAQAAGTRQQDAVREAYAATIKGEQGCCVVSGVEGTRMGYSEEELARGGLGELDQARMLGCGNPVQLANIQKGETVLDLGCGAGLDCFLAADAVGPTGSVIGVDMTPDMLLKARRNLAEQGRTNVSLRLGELEHLPVADGMVDVIISNCVINLCPDKGVVFREMLRVLAPGGRIAVSDVVATQELPKALLSAESLACWVAGAPSVDNVEPLLMASGFEQTSVVLKEESKEFIKDWLPGSGCEDYVVSANITARKPLTAPDTRAPPSPRVEEKGGACGPKGCN